MRDDDEVSSRISPHLAVAEELCCKASVRPEMGRKTVYVLKKQASRIAREVAIRRKMVSQP
jgi:hypothetical protein